MSRTLLEATALDWMRFWQGAGLGRFDLVHAPDFVDRSASGRPVNRNGFRDGIAALYRAFPDFAATIEFMAIDEVQSLVTIRWSAVGHMRGSFLGAEPAGQRVSFSGIEIIAVRGGQVSERWGEWDEGAVRAQIGLP